MTEAIKQWINKESASLQDLSSIKSARNGLTKGIEIAEGFSEWATPRGWRFNSISQMFENINPAAADLTTRRALSSYYQKNNLSR